MKETKLALVTILYQSTREIMSKRLKIVNVKAANYQLKVFYFKSNVSFIMKNNRLDIRRYEFHAMFDYH